MAATRNSGYPQDYFSIRQNSRLDTMQENLWDPEDISPIESYNSRESFSLSPKTPLSAYPSSSYGLSEDSSKLSLENNSALPFGSFDDWGAWDSPIIDTTSLTSSVIKTEPLSPTYGMAELCTQEGPTGKAASSVKAAASSNSMNIGDVAFDDAMNEEPLFRTPQSNVSPVLSNASSNVSPRNDLYSNTMAWDRPLQNMQLSAQYGTMNLSAAEQQRLRAIAMPNIKQELPPSPASVCSLSPPQEPLRIGTASGQRKRKSCVDDDDDDSEDGEQQMAPARRNSKNASTPVKKTAHNMIEKRYRTNLNDKIAALRDSVPSLRVMARRCSAVNVTGKTKGDEAEQEKDAEEVEELDGLAPAHKLNKATVLSKATEYIAHLEKRNKDLHHENEALKARVEAFELLMLAQSHARASPSSANPSSSSRKERARRAKVEIEID